jgi:uncharacterized membrane protein
MIAFVHRVLPPTWVIPLLRVALAGAFVFALLFQVAVFPGTFFHLAEEEPDLAYLRWWLIIGWGLVLVCVQVVLVCTWKLLTKVKEGEIFTEASLVWVDRIISAVLAGGLIVLGWFLYIAGQREDPGVPVLLMALLLAGGVLGLLLLVMRELLRQATTLRTDMEAVI